MPFIRGRYHINPVVGAALEAAREADEALGAHDADGQGNGVGPAGGGVPKRGSGAQAPIHRVEIEATEVVPSHSGQAQRGFVARIHRAGGAAVGGAKPTADQEFFGPSASAGAASGAGNRQGGRVVAQPPETHVFADHRDLTDFLRGELEKER